MNRSKNLTALAALMMFVAIGCQDGLGLEEDGLLEHNEREALEIRFDEDGPPNPPTWP